MGTGYQQPFTEQKRRRGKPFEKVFEYDINFVEYINNQSKRFRRNEWRFSEKYKKQVK